MTSAILKLGTVLPLVAAVVGFAPAALAEESPHAFSANVGLYSQYVFRGLTQTGEEPAIQGGFDYGNANGAYAGTWLSNISWFSDANPDSSSSLEWDLYLGYRHSWDNGWGVDAGYVRYQYPGDYVDLPPGTVKPNTDELYAGGSWKWLSLKYYYAFSDLFGVEDSEGSWYLDFTATIPVGEQLSLALHAGHQDYQGTSVSAAAAGTDNDELYTYSDYRATLAYKFGVGWSTSLSYTGTDAKDSGYTVRGKNLGDNQVVLGISRSF